ncbi:protein rapunzel-like [Tachysurus vachellii]|uniref:protein rapunzel-like n=1 Tax=Tachysurus vachellii TaxID=175792 RepID=UPI00296AF749|nr:protein rapunzel-like [Tachysurus vachellii]XP_060717974.1 protein rapunzel-like [Tachysurus vachellii]
MADTSDGETEIQIKHTVATVLGCLEKGIVIASAFIPLIGIVTPIVGAVKKTLVEDNKIKMLEKEFQQIHDKLESISQQTEQMLDQIQLSEIEINYGQAENSIKFQYQAFQNMMDHIRKDPEDSEHYREEFKKIYRNQKGLKNLNVYYDAIMEDQGPFGQPLLKFYQNNCKRNKKIMEARCAHLSYLFYIGLIAEMAYKEVIEDDQEMIRKEWGQKLIDIQTKMQEALDECNEKE